MPAVHRLGPQVFYGWWIVGGAFWLSLVTVGIGYYGQTVFLDGLIRERGWTKEAVSGASTVYFVVSGVAGTIVGRAVDRWGARVSIALGAVAMALALVWVGRVDSPAELGAAYVALAISFAMTSAVPVNAVLARWFVARRAFAMSLSQTGVSLGGFVLVPVSMLLIASQGMRVTTVCMALLVLVVVLPVNAWVLRWDPADYGLAPDGVGTPRDSGGEEPRSWRTREVLRERSFAWLALAFSLILLSQTGLSVHLLHLLREHLDANIAAGGVSIVTVGSICGRLVVGQIADRINMRKLAACLFVMQAVALLALSQSTTAVSLVASTLFFGLTIGSVFMLQSLIALELFGVVSFGKVFGLLNLLSSVGGGLGPLLVGVLAARAGGYPVSLRVLAVIASLAAVAILRVKPPAASGAA